MDSLTQLVFGAACGQAVLGRQIGRKAAGWGAVLGTLPDLDVFIPLGGPVDDFVYHRGFSHSFIVLGLLAPVLAWALAWIHREARQDYRRWLLLCFVVLQGAVVLDLMTIYGTQVLWPVDTTPRAIPVLFIIDPLFTLPILLGVLCGVLANQQSSFGHRANRLGLTLSVAYLVWAVGVGQVVKSRVADKLDQQGIAYGQFVATPAPFTTLLWRVVGINEDRYFETYLSLFDGEAPLIVTSFPRNLALLKGIELHPPVAKLKRFTRGYYALSQEGDAVVMTDLRMGAEPNYVFRFRVGQATGSVITPVADMQVRNPRDWSQLQWVWRRIWTPLPPE